MGGLISNLGVTMEDDIKSEELIVLEKGVEGAFSFDMVCCPGSMAKA